jgi:large subunit ribosomal protein L15
MYKLNTVRAPAGSRTTSKRKGRGIGSGWGKTAGKGHKGQKARSGGYVRPWFEGGQVPIQRRAAKYGFPSELKKFKHNCNISTLIDFAGKDCKLADLLPKSFRKHPRVHLTIGGVHVPKKFPKSVEAHKVTPLAKTVLEKAGVSIKILEYKAGVYSTRQPKKGS